MPLQIFLRLVFGKLLEFVGHVFMDGRAAAGWDEIIAKDARFQSAFVSIERRAPGIFLIGGIAIAAVLPYDPQIGVIESGEIVVITNKEGSVRPQEKNDVQEIDLDI